MARKSETGATETTAAPLDAMTGMQQAGVSNMLGVSAAWMEALGAMNAEMARFVADRIKQDVRVQHEVLNCRDIGRLQEIQTRFMEDAIEQYQAETGKLVDMGTQAFFNGMKDGKGNKT